MKSNNTLQRYLDREEASMSGTPVAIFEYEGDVDDAALTRALGLLCVRYPDLRGHIIRDDQGYRLEVPSNHQPEIVIYQEDDISIDDLLKESLDTALALAKLVLVRGDGRGTVLFYLNHSLFDGRRAQKVLGDLWSFYTCLVNGTRFSVDPGSIPESPNDRLRQEQIKMADSLLTSESAPPLAVCDPIGHRIDVCEEITAAIVAAAHTHGTTVNALVSGSILVALREHGTTSEPARMVSLQIVNLRNRLELPVRDTEVTSFAIRHRIEIVVPPYGDPLVIGMELDRMLKAAITTREFRKDPLASPPPLVETPLEQRLATMMVSNMGVQPTFAVPSGFTITDYDARMPSKAVLFPCYVVYTYGGKMRLFSWFPSKFFTNDEVDSIAKNSVKQMCAVIEQGSSPRFEISRVVRNRKVVVAS